MSNRWDCGCPGPVRRRDFLKVGALGGLGLSLGDFLAFRSDPALAGVEAKADAIIQIFLHGGMSHLDTFDPKPGAPIEYRGELGVAKTNTGEYVGGQLPKLAACADKYALLRSMTHGEAAHERGIHNMLTGYRPSPAIAYPSMGSVVAHEVESRNNLPPYICIPNAAERYLGTGYLSAAYGPFSVGGEPASDGFEVRDLSLPGGVDSTRMEGRKNLLAAVDDHFKTLESSDALSAMDSYYQRAYAMISSAEVRKAFDIRDEAAEMRDAYGRSNMGQRLLLARRLVEAGARFVTVSDSGWDHHKGIKDALQSQLPPVDQAVSQLLNDLAARGLLERTVVVLATEFGRTVRLNKDGGRDHWPKAFSVLIAGGGLKGGAIVGETDPRGSEPTRDPVSPENLAATLFTQIGIDPSRKLMSAGNRPIDIVRGGKVIESLVS